MLERSCLSEIPEHMFTGTVDPPLSGPSAYNDLRMRVVAVADMAAKSVALSTEDRQVVGQGCLPLSSSLVPRPSSNPYPKIK